MSGAGEPILIVSLLVGAAALALWLHVRLAGRLTPTGRNLVLHLAGSFAYLMVAPAILGAVAFGGERGALEVAALMTIFLPALVYALLVSLWLLGYLRDALAGARG